MVTSDLWPSHKAHVWRSLQPLCSSTQYKFNKHFFAGFINNLEYSITQEGKYIYIYIKLQRYTIILLTHTQPVIPEPTPVV